MGRLAGGVAYDFNNILSVILGYAELLEGGVSPQDPRTPYVHAIREAGERAARLTRQLLAFSRREVVAKKTLDLIVVVADIEKLLHRLIGEHVRLRVTLGADAGAVLADTGQLEQVLMNLAVNARDAMPAGGTLSIETRGVDVHERDVVAQPEFRPGPYALLSVSDTGCGMDGETLAHVYEPFFTTKPVGQGTGLGLATVYGIVIQNDGHIDVKSVPGAGTTFRIYLPRTNAISSGMFPALALDSTPQTGTILLVEDDPGVRRLAHILLQNAGYTVVEARDGVEALAISRALTGEVDLLLTDVVMPGMSGPELARVLMAERPGLDVVLMSGYTADLLGSIDSPDAGLRLLRKPFMQSSLVRAVRSALSKEPLAPR